MKAKDLISQMQVYQRLNGGSMPKAEHGDPVGCLLVRDEVALSSDKRQFRLFKDDDWRNISVDCLGFEWICWWNAAGQENPEGKAFTLAVVFGVGSPFSEDWVDILPTKNGKIMAVPDSLRRQAS